ncbi:hypothetical protein N9L75_03750 [Porticoccaceae bacterium]|nr:hypothetical protein [Porticoccaceae bacterium]MDA8651670.1 hypothetical protein [Porticoccaceae bacterium]MDA8682082.1 hypothetical protein [Porticoccaceae bacterium]MDB2664385.1 hypothetical protein [Porticoccaceae bacterium]
MGVEIKLHTVNSKGLEMIRQELLSRCKPEAFNGWLEDDLRDSKESNDIVGEWASLLEGVLDDGNGDSVEIGQFYTKSGHVEHLCISDEGIDFRYEVLE